MRLTRAGRVCCTVHRCSNSSAEYTRPVVVSLGGLRRRAFLCLLAHILLRGVCVFEQRT